VRGEPVPEGITKLVITVLGNTTSEATAIGFDSSIDECIEARAKKWAFPRSDGPKDVVHVEIAFTVAPMRGVRDIPKRDHGVVVTYGTAKITGQLDVKRATGVLKTDLRAQEHCFAAVDKTTTGGLPDGIRTLSIEVDGEGKVTSTSLIDAELELAACLHRRIQRLQFPPPKDRKPAGITMQLSFKKKR
jgi:hypothetical protein